MNVNDLFSRLRIDGEPVGNVLQITVDQEKCTVIFEKTRNGMDPAQRAITVESEAVTFG